MKWNEYFTMSSRNIIRRKLRSWLTVFGIVIAIATIFVLISISLGLDAAVKEQFRQLGADKFFIQPKGELGAPGTASVVQLTDDDLDTIKRVSGVKDYSYWTLGSARIEFFDQIRFVSVAGLPTRNMDVFVETGFLKLEEGQLITSGDTKKIVIGSQYVHNNFFSAPVQVGNTLTINDQEFKVKGILASVGNPADDRIIYLSFEDFDTLFPEKEGTYSQIAVQVDPGVDMDDIVERVRDQLIRSRGLTEDTQDFTILTPEELLATFGAVLNILTGFLLGVGAISLLVGCIGITNTMYTAVLERTKEIGVMKAIGATNANIIALFTIESGLIGLIGGAGGIIIGYGIAQLIEFIVGALGVTLLQVATPWYLIVGSLIFSFVIGAIAGVVPAYHAARIRPVQALRYE